MGKSGWGAVHLPVRWCLAALLLLSLLVSVTILPRSLHAATLHVSSCSGNPATTGALGNVVAAASSGDTIVFDQDCTVTLTTTLVIPANKNLTIDANQHTVVLDGNTTLQVLHLLSANNHGPSVTLNGLTIQHGKAAQGGAIFNDQGTLTITRSSIINNTATISGGGIENAGGTLKVTNATFFGNKVTGTTQAAGGAINNNAFGTVTLVSSTISGNSVSSPVPQSASGGGVYDFASAAQSLTITDTIVAANEGGNCNGADIGSKNANGVISGGHNLIGIRHNDAADARCGVDFATLTSTSGDLVGTDAAPLSAKLGSLGNNGGHTPTLPLLLGSPAIDAGGATCPAGVTTDQRGQPRPAGAGCDIGAVEGSLAVQGITVSVTNRGTATLIVGQTVTLHAVGTFTNGDTADVSSQVQWSSDATGVAAVNVIGVVIGVSAGDATVTAAIGGTQGHLAISVLTPSTNPVPPAPSGRSGGATGDPPAPAPPSR